MSMLSRIQQAAATCMVIVVAAPLLRAQSCPARLPTLTVRKLDNATAPRLHAALNPPAGAAPQWSTALSIYFGCSRTDLLDWVVYLRADGTVSQALLQAGRDGRRRSEERYVWAVVFSDKPLLHATANPNNVVLSDTTDLWASRRTVAFRQDPALTALLKGLLHTFSIDLSSDGAAPDSSFTIAMRPVSDDPGHPLYAGVGRFNLTENTETELGIRPVRPNAFTGRGATEDSVTAVFTNFVNARRHTFELGVIGGMTYGHHTRSFNDNLTLKSQGPRTAFNAYVSAFINLPGTWFDSDDLRQVVPFVPERSPWWQLSSLGVFVGTNASGAIGDQLVAGVALGHVLSDAGVSVGSAWTDEQFVRGGHLVTRKMPRLLFGVDLRL